MFFASLLIQEGRRLLALTRLAKTVRAHIRPENFPATSTETVGEIVEPMSELVQRKNALTDPALYGHYWAQ
jgi:hypothetical protein